MWRNTLTDQHTQLELKIEEQGFRPPSPQYSTSTSNTLLYNNQWLYSQQMLCQFPGQTEIPRTMTRWIIDHLSKDGDNASHNFNGSERSEISSTVGGKNPPPLASTAAHFTSIITDNLFWFTGSVLTRNEWVSSHVLYYKFCYSMGTLQKVSRTDLRKMDQNTQEVKMNTI